MTDKERTQITKEKKRAVVREDRFAVKMIPSVQKAIRGLLDKYKYTYEHIATLTGLSHAYVRVLMMDIHKSKGRGPKNIVKLERLEDIHKALKSHKPSKD